MASNQAERWLMPRMESPVSGNSIMACWVCCRTDSGNAPGPPEKFSALDFIESSSRFQWDRSGACRVMQHRLERVEDTPHLWQFVGECLRIIHIVHDHRGGDFEHQQTSVMAFGAIEADILQP